MERSIREGALGRVTPADDRPLAQPIVLPYNGSAPRVAADAFLAPGCAVIGDVEIGPGASVWFNAVIRGDVAPVRIGARSNVQDGAVLHVDTGVPCIVGEDVTIGHRAIVHGSSAADGATIGMGATVLSRSAIGAGAIVAAGALVPEGATIGAGKLAMGVPAREKRDVTAAERERMRSGAARYVQLARAYRGALTGQEPAEAQADGD